jgi:hypothetical protein
MRTVKSSLFSSSSMTFQLILVFCRDDEVALAAALGQRTQNFSREDPRSNKVSESLGIPSISSLAYSILFVPYWLNAALRTKWIDDAIKVTPRT